MIIGDSSTWLGYFRDVHERIIEIIAQIWPQCSPAFCSSTLENTITDKLAFELRNHPRARTNWLVIPQYKLLAEGSWKGDVVTKGFIDFAVFFTMNQDHYIPYECKRLNVNFKSGFEILGDKYVAEGLCRYVSAQYAQDLPFGVMVGYVLDGDVAKAIAAVKTQIDKKAAKLGCYETPPIVDLPSLSTITRFSTKHLRQSATIEVEHFFLPLSQPNLL